MKTPATILFLLFTNIAAFTQSNTSLKLWYKQPAKASIPDSKDAWKDDEEWLKALPLGNGNIGAMVFGDVNRDRIQLNEKTLWSGSNYDNDNPEAPKYLSEIRNLLFDGKYKEATELTYKTQVCKGVGSGNGNGADTPYGCFQTLGDLWIDFGNQSAYSKYYRELNLSNALAGVTYLQNGIAFKREYFVSAPANALVVKFSANKKGAISFTVSLNRPEKYTTTFINGELVMTGTLNNGKGGSGMQYMTRLKAGQDGGTQTNNQDKLIIRNANEVVLYLTASTDYLPNYPLYKGRDYDSITKSNLDNAVKKDYNILKKEHIADFQKYFNRVSLKLTDPKIVDTIPTDERLNRIKETKNDNFLTQLYFQFGRYLLISSARENTLPANLQGIWANKIQTPWNCDYHTNINVQMNYWLAENANLSELHLSLTNFIQSIEKPATKSAGVQFGLEGWCINPIVNIWGFTSPGEHPSWGLTSGAGGWICQHLWEHYAFTLDKNYLKKVYPTLKNAARFYLDWLVADKETGKLVSGPASSPENQFWAPDGTEASISMGPSHDQKIIDELFSNVLKAAEILNDTDSLIIKIKAAKANLQPVQIGEDGRIMEWAKPYKEVHLGHRHISHVYALYPGNAFNQEQTPEYFNAAQKSIEVRLKNGGAQTGWSAAWCTNLWARLKTGDEALNMFNKILTERSAPNLFDLHPPFQIDGNLGATAGVAEMLLQSHEGYIELLPALPSSWENGEVRGLCARGGFVVDMKWKNAKLLSSKLFSKHGGVCKIKYQNKIIEVDIPKNKSITKNYN